MDQMDQIDDHLGDQIDDQIEEMGRAMEQGREAPAAAETDPEAGNNLVEYTLLLALIVLVCFLAVGFLGNTTSSQFESIGGSLGGL